MKLSDPADPKKTGFVSPDQPGAHLPGKPAWRGNFFTGFVYAFAGLSYVLRTQRNMRVHLVLAFLAVALGFWLGLSLVEWAVLVLTIALVIVLEMVNTVIESLVDLVTQEYHPLAKVSKDVAAGAVLLAAIFAVIIALILFGPRLVQQVFHLV